MSETTETPAAETEPVKTETETVEVDYKSEAEKWKSFSRQNEDKYKKAAAELEELRKANLTDAEKAIEDAKAAGRAEAEAAFQSEKLNYQLKAAAAEHGISEDVLNLVDPSKLIVNGEVQADLLKSLAAPKFQKSASDLGLGARSSNGAGQISREDLARMSPAEINKAREEGKLNDLMSGRM